MVPNSLLGCSCTLKYYIHCIDNFAYSFWIFKFLNPSLTKILKDYRCDLIFFFLIVVNKVRASKNIMKYMKCHFTILKAPRNSPRTPRSRFCLSLSPRNVKLPFPYSSIPRGVKFSEELPSLVRHKLKKSQKTQKMHF